MKQLRKNRAKNRRKTTLIYEWKVWNHLLNVFILSRMKQLRNNRAKNRRKTTLIYEWKVSCNFFTFAIIVQFPNWENLTMKLNWVEMVRKIYISKLLDLSSLKELSRTISVQKLFSNSSESEALCYIRSNITANWKALNKKIDPVNKYRSTFLCKKIKCQSNHLNEVIRQVKVAFNKCFQNKFSKFSYDFWRSILLSFTKCFQLTSGQYIFWTQSFFFFNLWFFKILPASVLK